MFQLRWKNLAYLDPGKGNKGRLKKERGGGGTYLSFIPLRSQKGLRLLKAPKMRQKFFLFTKLVDKYHRKIH